LGFKTIDYLSKHLFAKDRNKSQSLQSLDKLTNYAAVVRITVRLVVTLYGLSVNHC